MNALKEATLAIFGAIGGYIVYLFGGWDSSMATLLIFMSIDYATGLAIAAVFKASPKSPNGALESRAGWKGLCRKGMSLLVVLIACRLDIALGINYLRNAVIIAFIANEAISIIENAGLMGVPMLPILTKAIDVLKGKSERSE